MTRRPPLCPPPLVITRPHIGELVVPENLRQWPIWPGNGYPPNPGEDRPGLSPFGRLSKGGAFGKSSILVYDSSSDDYQPAAVPMLQLEGDNLDAQQMVVTLAPPRVVQLSFDDVLATLNGQQNLTGEMSNAEVTADNFPGDIAPIKWPPLEAIVEWGVGGAQAQAVIDFVNGVTFNVTASYVRVYAAITQSQEIGEINGTSAAYYLAAFIGPGWSKDATARRTIYTGTVANNAESEVFDIPKFAKRCFIVGATDLPTPVVTAGYIRLWQSPDGTNSVGDFFQNSNQPMAFDIPNGAQYFSIFNQSGSTMRFSAIFELAL